MSREMQQKTVLKLNLRNEKDKKKAMKIVSGFDGVDSIAVSFKDGKLTVTGISDPVDVTGKLRKKLFPTTIESVVSVKDEKKGNDQAKADDKKNNAGGKDQKGGAVPITYYTPYLYQSYPPRPAPPSYYYDQYWSIEEDSNWCVIL